MRLDRTLLIIVLAICIFETVRLWLITPDRMASHFDVAGNPDRYAAKAQFFSFENEIMLVVIGMDLVTQVFVSMTPVEWLNMKMPNREYWISPEHHDEMMDRMSSFAAILFGMVTLGVHAGLELAAYANLSQPILFNVKPADADCRIIHQHFGVAFWVDVFVPNPVVSILI